MFVLAACAGRSTRSRFTSPLARRAGSAKGGHGRLAGPRPLGVPRTQDKSVAGAFSGVAEKAARLGPRSIQQAPSSSIQPNPLHPTRPRLSGGTPPPRSSRTDQSDANRGLGSFFIAWRQEVNSGAGSLQASYTGGFALPHRSDRTLGRLGRSLERPCKWSAALSAV